MAVLNENASVKRPGLDEFAKGRDVDWILACLRNDWTVAGMIQYPRAPVSFLLVVLVLLGAVVWPAQAQLGGSVVAWGYNSKGQSTVPAAASGAVSIASGGNHSLALLHDGQVVGWGNNQVGQATPPTGLAGVMAIAAGGDRSLALRSDGTVVQWGDNTYPVPAGLAGVACIAAGDTHSLALLHSGVVVAWGDNRYGQTQVPSFLNGVMAIAAGRGFSLALRWDGRVIAWGHNDVGQCDVPAGLEGVVAITAGFDGVLALLVDGTVASWGSPLGDPLPAGLTNIMAIANGHYHSLALDRAGLVTAWGWNGSAQTSVPTNLAGVVGIAAGGAHSLAVLGDGPPVAFTGPMVVTVDAGQPLVIRPTVAGQFPIEFQWRHNGAEIPGATNTFFYLPAVALTDAGSYSLAALNAKGSLLTAVYNVTVTQRPPTIQEQPMHRTSPPGGEVAFQVRATGSAPLSYQWFLNGNSIAEATGPLLNVTGVDGSMGGIYTVQVSNTQGSVTSQGARLDVLPVIAVGNNQFGQANVPTEAADAVSLAAGYGFSLALTRSGKVIAWGDSRNSKLKVPPQATNIIAIAALGEHSLALRKNGTVMAWGRNDYGQTNVPAGLRDIVAVAAGWEHSLALSRDGRVQAWGNNNDGQCSLPPSLFNVVAIAAGGFHSLALCSDGKVVAWGRNQFGQCNIPQDLPPAIHIGAGYWQSYALHAQETVTAWGDTSGFPPDLAGVVSLTIGGSYAWAVKRDGSILTWMVNAPALPIQGSRRVTLAFDNNDSGNLEGFYLYLGQAPKKYTKTINLGDATVVRLEDLEANLDYYAVTTAYNAYGRESDPSNEIHFKIPAPSTQLPSNLVTASLVAGYDHVLALSASGAPVFLTQPASRDGFVGSSLMLTAQAIGSSTIQYQWLFEDSPLAGAQSASLVLSPLQLSKSGNYSLVASNPLGAVTSTVAQVRVLDSTPVFLDQPQPQITILGEQCVLQALATGNEPLRYQWMFNHSNLEGATNATLTLPRTAYGDAGTYTVAAFNEHGSELSQGAEVSVVPVVVWGSNTQGEAATPAGLKSVVAVDGGPGYSVALRADRTAVAWGGITEDEEEEEELPSLQSLPWDAPATNLVAVAAGTGHTLALQGDGTLVGWDSQGASLTNLPPDLEDVVAISVHQYRNLALRSDGTVVAWLHTDDGSPIEETRQTVPAKLTNVVGIAAGGTLNAALKADGTVALWQVDNALWRPVTNAISALTDVLSLAAGDAHLVALRRDGSVTSFNPYYPAQGLPPLTGVVSISADWYHSLALKLDGTVVAWGDNYSGESSIPLTLSNAVAVGAGWTHSLALKSDRALATLIAPAHRKAYTGTSVFMVAPPLDPPTLAYQWLHANQAIPDATKPYLRLTGVGLESGGEYSLVMSNAFGAFTNVNTILTPTDSAPLLIGDLVDRISYNLGSTVLKVNTEGSLPMTFQWRFFGADIAGATNATLTFPRLSTVSQGEYSVVMSNAFGIAESSAASLVVVPVAALHNLSFVAQSPPVQLTNAVELALADGEFLALRRDGSVVSWSHEASVPYPVPALPTPAVAISAGENHAVALLSNGLVRAWGDYSLGQTFVPSNLSNVVQVSCGPEHSLALKRDGGVVAWGRSIEGQTRVPADATNIVAISAGQYHNLALRGDGRVLVWGEDDPSIISVPDDLTEVVAIAAGNGFNLALRANGTVVGWGRRDSDDPIYLPPGLTNIVSIAMGSRRAWAWRRNGTAVIWDYSAENLLVAPPGLTNVTTVADAGSESLVLLDDGLPFITLAPQGRIAYSGSTHYFRVQATGQLPLQYQWQFNEEDILDATNAVLTLSNIDVDYAGKFRVVVSNPAGQMVSAPVDLTVIEHPPILLRLVADNSARLHERAVFQVSTDGSKPIQYQWNFQGAPLPGATNAVLDLDQLSLAQQGVYTVVISNAIGTLHCTNQLLIRQVVSWSEEGPVQDLVPADLTNAVVVAMGWNHGLALRSDNALSIWGTYGNNQPATLPPGVNHAVAIAAGGHHDLAVLENGTVVAWGENDYGQGNVPPTLGPAKAVAAGALHSLVLTKSGALVCWGDNRYGQADVPPHLVRTAAIAAGEYHNLVVDQDGRVAGWGDNRSGQLNIPPAATNVVAVAAGESHSLALRGNGTVVAWGNNTFGQVSVPSGLSNVVDISAGGNLSGALLKNNTAVLWGDFSSDNLNTIDALEHINGLALGKSLHAILLGDGPPQIYLSPSGGSAYPGSTIRMRVAAAGLGRLRYLWYRNGIPLAGETSPFFIRRNVQASDAGVYTVEVDNPLSLATSLPASWQVFNAAPFLLSPPPTQTALPGSQATLRLAAEGTRPFSYQWFYEQTPIPGATNADLVLGNLFGSKAGNYTARITNSQGSFFSPPLQVRLRQLIGWGANEFGQNTVPDSFDDPKAIASGSGHNMVLTRAGQVLCWGDNSQGQCNPPAALDHVVAIAAGSHHSLALQDNGRVVAWGAPLVNPNGWPDTLSNIVAVAAGGDLSLALRANGTVAAWGNIGNPPANLTSVAAIAAGNGHALALKADGRVVAWGQNACAQASVPQTLVNAVAIAAGDAHSLALRSDGTVVGWGCNEANQIRIPSNVQNVIALSAGRQHSLALLANGTLASWGGGDGSAAILPSLVTSSGTLNAFAIASAGSHNLVLFGDPSLQFTKFQMSTLTQANHAFSMVLPTRRGRSYRMEYTDALTPTIWKMLPPVPGENTMKTLTDPAAAVSGRFYRVRLVPGSEESDADALNPSSFGRQSNRFSLSVPTVLGTYYFLQYKQSLSDSNWISLPMVPGRGGIVPLVDEAANAPERYYRVRQW